MDTWLIRSSTTEKLSPLSPSTPSPPHSLRHHLAQPSWGTEEWFDPELATKAIQELRNVIATLQTADKAHRIASACFATTLLHELITYGHRYHCPEVQYLIQDYDPQWPQSYFDNARLTSDVLAVFDELATALQQALKDHDPDVSVTAALSLATLLGSDAPPLTVAVLNRALSNNRFSNRAADALVKLGHRAPSQTGIPLSAVGSTTDKDSDPANAIFDTSAKLRKCDTIISRDIPQLDTIIQNESSDLRLMALLAVADADDGSDVIPTVILTISDPDDVLSETARATLSRIFTTEDELYRSFALTFLTSAFRPDAITNNTWMNDVFTHPWYLNKLTTEARRRRRDWWQLRSISLTEVVDTARSYFATKLLRNPTLGLDPERYATLRSLVWVAGVKHAISHSAESLGPRFKRTGRTASVSDSKDAQANLICEIPLDTLADHPLAAEQDSQAVLAERESISHQAQRIHALLTSDFEPLQRAAVLGKCEGRTYAEIARQHHVKPHQVKYAYQTSIARLRSLLDPPD